MEIDLSVSWLGLSMASPLFNASGVMCRHADELDRLAASCAGAVITKSCTLEPRAGNPEPRYAALPFGSINSMGLPNEGFRYYLDYARRYDYGRGKPLFVSVSGMSADETLTILGELARLDLPCLPEVNLSCPNVPGKPQTGYDFAASAALLDAIVRIYPKTFGVKLPPYFDPVHFDMMADVLRAYPTLGFVTCINSIGNALVVDVERELALIRPKDGLGGLGGSYVLPTALANVREFARRLPDRHVVGCGGVTSGAEAFMHILCGATVVQIGTCLYEEGPGAFERIAAELSALMRSKGYRTLDAFRGRLGTP
ncbi:dihydroorotate dehydrogenase A (fumarate) [Paludibacterium paludis]|uniref:dihydroorotate oxidase (fumarate) n=2 Tax=Paludibacterium paludis TaxID=1225769 RepID=A0A918NY54_9NEIS|nr:dihydroorotate oxidase [Paludibacterium paludis]GGY05213.1 dihydroorotate dehydrogenase A (fumarate) [Paludibacterium paludis]